MTLIRGWNATGKTNVLRALMFLATIARDGLTAALDTEGGWESMLWAGPEMQLQKAQGDVVRAQGALRRAPLSVALGVRTEEVNYSVDVGLSPIDSSALEITPEIKRESVWRGDKLRPSTLLADRRGPLLQTRDATGRLRIQPFAFLGTESMHSRFSSDLCSLPELSRMHEYILGWRFFEELRTDRTAPGREPGLATPAFSLGPGGKGLSSVLYTIQNVGFGSELSAAVAGAFPDAELIFTERNGYLSVSIQYRRLLRTVTLAEFSQGIMRFLLLAAALLAPKPGTMICFDEPEMSLHPNVMDTLVRLFDFAARHSHIWIITHSPELRARLERLPGCRTIELSKDAGETVVEGVGIAEQPQWTWPTR